MTNVKDKRATTHRLVNKVVCFDCGEATGSAMLVKRQMGPVGDTYEGVAYVHRTNTGCHKGWTAADVRDPSRRTRRVIEIIEKELGERKLRAEEDRAILEISGHPQGPRFNGPGAVRCRNYDEHRWDFYRRNGIWVCPECDA